MKITKCILAIIMVIFLMCVDLVMHTSIHAKNADDLLTFDFEKTTVADALQEITRVTGIKIHINKPFNKEIVGKSFLEADLEYILKNLFSQENVTVEWIYGQRGLDTVFITIHENQKDQRSILPPTRPFDYGSNVMGNIPVPSINQTTVLGNATASPENTHLSESSKVAVPPPPPPVKQGFVPTPVPPVKQGHVPPPPMPPGFLSR